MPAVGQNRLAVIEVLFDRATEDEYSAVVNGDASGVLFGSNASRQGDSHVFPYYDDYRHFFNRVLTPGVPGALPPVESLYEDWGGHRAGLQHGQGFYRGRSAQRVDDLCAQLEISLPERFSATPDHLLILLELNDFLCDNAPDADARSFAQEHFAWLEDYRGALDARMADETDERLTQVAVLYERAIGCIRDIVLDGLNEDVSGNATEGAGVLEKRRCAKRMPREPFANRMQTDDCRASQTVKAISDVPNERRHALGRERDANKEVVLP